MCDPEMSLTLVVTVAIAIRSIRYPVTSFRLCLHPPVLTVLPCCARLRAADVAESWGMRCLRTRMYTVT